MTSTIAGIVMPASAMARKATEFIRDCEPDIIFNHSVRVFLFGALMGQRKNLTFDRELLYVASLFHDLGLMEGHTTPDKRFEVDGADAARHFLHSHGASPEKAQTAWEAVALHTTPGIAEYMRPEIALCRAGVRMDVVGTAYEEFLPEEREAVLAAHPRHDFKTGFITCQAANARTKPQTTFGTINFDYLEWTDPSVKKINQCANIMNAPWES